MEDHLATVAREEQRQARHRVGMVHVDDIIVAADLPQGHDQRGGNHGGSHLRPGRTRRQPGMRIELRHAAPALACRTQHVAVDAFGGQSQHEVVHDLLHPASDGIELSQL